MLIQIVQNVFLNMIIQMFNFVKNNWDFSQLFFFERSFYCKENKKALPYVEVVQVESDSNHNSNAPIKSVALLHTDL